MMRPPRTRDDLVVSDRPNGEGVLVYDPATDTGHVLEGAAALVFAACDGTVDGDALAAHIASSTGSPTQPAAIDAALAELTAAGLLEGERGLSRRTLIGGLVAGAAAIAIAPVITSVSRPTRAAAQPAPSVEPKSATTPQDTAVPIALSSTGLTAAVAVYWCVTQPTHGTVTVTHTSSGGDNTGAVATYTPNPGYTGPDSFTYTAGECIGPPGTLYTAPPEAVAACPATLTIFNTSVPPATVTITVTPTPTTTTAPEDSTPKFTG